MNIGKKIAIGFALCISLLVAIGFVAYQNIDRLLITNQWVVHTYEVLGTLEAMEAGLMEAEGASRAFLLTGKENYRQQFRTGTEKALKAHAKVRTLTIDNPPQTRRCDLLLPLLQQRIQFSEGANTRREVEGAKGAAAAITEGTGLAMTRQIQAIEAELREAELQLLGVRQADAESRSVFTRYVILLGTIVAALLAILASWVIIRAITTSVRDVVGRLTSTSSEILAGTSEQAATAQEQAASVAETVTTVDEVTATSEHASQRAQSLGDSVTQSLATGRKGREALDNSIRATNLVKKQIDDTATNILNLATQAQAIGDIIASVSDIAEQTNILALNAAIEAARAGDQGKGFSVVASEIRLLAEQSKRATNQVRQILGDIQKATNSAVIATEQVTNGVSSAVRVIESAGETISVLTETLTKAAEVASQIVASAGQQATGMSQINLAMRNLDQAANQNMAATQQAEKAAQGLSVLGAQLTGLVGA